MRDLNAMSNLLKITSVEQSNMKIMWLMNSALIPPPLQALNVLRGSPSAEPILRSQRGIFKDFPSTLSQV